MAAYLRGVTLNERAMEITKQEVKSLLLAESTNASRTFVRNDGVSEFEQVVIDDQ